MQVKNKRNIYFVIIFSILIIAILLAGVYVAPIRVEASSPAMYAISDWHKKDETRSVFSGQEGCTYVINLQEDSAVPIKRIFYSGYQISMQNEFEEQEDIINDFARDKNGDDVDEVEVLQEEIEYGDYNNQNLRQLSFEITIYEWAAYQFFVEWDNYGESQLETSNFLYCINIDDSPPHLELTEEPIYQDGGFLFRFRARANAFGTYRSANSGFKRIRVYRREGENPREILVTYEDRDFYNPLNFYGEFLAKEKGRYFIEAVDGVGNTTLVQVFDIKYDRIDGIMIDNVEDILQKQEQYRSDLIADLKEVYLQWQKLKVSSDDGEEIEQARNKVSVAFINCRDAKVQFESRIINNFYFDEIEILNLDINTYDDVVKGEKVFINMSLANLMPKDAKDFAEITSTVDMKNVGTIYAIYMDVTSDLVEHKKTSFTEPMQIKISLANYKQAKAVLQSNIDGKDVYTELRMDLGKDWVIVYVPSVGTVNIIVGDGDGNNLRYLYFLFLIIPIAVGAVLLIYYKDKIFKNKGRNQSTPKKQEAEEQKKKN